MPIVEEPRFAGFTARMMELTSTQTQWHRRLWRSGTLQIGQELLEESIRPGAKESAISDQAKYLKQCLQTDRGIEDHGRRVHGPVSALRVGATDSSHAWIELREHLDKMHESYLANWANALDGPPSGNTKVDVEGAARRITAHLLDAGMHKSSLYSWLRKLQDPDVTPESMSLGDFVRATEDQLKRPLRPYTFCVPVETKPGFDITPDTAPGWMNSGDTSKWKRDYAPTAKSVRHQGSFLLIVQARDVNAAADEARSEISNLVTKFQLGASNPIVVCPRMWSKDRKTDFATTATNRMINVRSFERLDRVQELETVDYITNTLALAQPLRTGAPHIAVMSGWSAIESLMVGPADEQDIVAARRFSLIVAASMLRAELNDLSRRYAETHRDEPAAQMRACEENIDRARLFQQHAQSSANIDLGRVDDNSALARIRPALGNPGQEVQKITEILTREFTRLYRKRNMIVHGGQINGSNLHSISETLTPLIGAGIDRVVHVGLKYGVKPVELSAMAESRLHYLAPASANSAGNLLDLLEFP